MLRSVNALLFRPIGILPLAAFRVVFGILMVLQFVEFRQAFLLDYAQRSYFIRYDFFQWVPSLPADAWSWLFWLAIAASICFTLGIAYRIAAMVQSVLLAFILLQEQSMYNNHYYLFWLLSVLMAFTDAHKALSITTRAGKAAFTIPNWQLLAIRLQIAVLYFFGGIAKLNADWLLHAQPIKVWLPQMMPFTDGMAESSVTFIAFFVAYSGLLIDLSVGFLLFTRYKWWAMAMLVPFHFSNSQMFSIGYFPWFGIFSLLVFIDDNEWRWLFKKLGINLNEVTQTTVSPRPVITSVFIGWFAIQALLPLRHWLLPGNVHWNMNGYYLSWFMKLNDNAPLLRFEVEMPDSRRYTFDMAQLAESPSQRSLIASNPFVAVKFANDVERYLKQQQKVSGDIKVYCDSYISLNGRPLQRKIDPTVDLTALQLSPLGKYFTRHDWTIPLGNDTLTDAKVIYQMKKLEDAL